MPSKKRRNKPRPYRFHTELQFLDALREFLGLAPLTGACQRIGDEALHKKQSRASVGRAETPGQALLDALDNHGRVDTSRGAED